MNDTMNQNAYQKALKTYQKNSDENLTPLQIVVELYKGMLKNTKLAKSAWESNQLDVMTNYIVKVFDIIEALQSNLDIEKGGEDAKFLLRFYSVIFSALSQVTAKPDPKSEFDAIIAYIQQVHDRWYTMAYGNKAETPS